MARPLGHIRVLFSSRVLFDLEEADKIFQEKGKQAYTDYMCCRGEYEKDFNPTVKGRLLKKGPLFDIALAMEKINGLSKEKMFEIVLTCKDETDSAVAIFRNLDVTPLGGSVHYRIATSGKPIGAEKHESLKTDLFLTRSSNDAQIATDLGIASAVINFPPMEGTYNFEADGKPIRLYVDGDAVAFGDSAELRYRREGLTVYRELEDKEFDKPVEAGPFTAVLAKISKCNDDMPEGQKPFEITLLTARGANAGTRALATALSHGIKFNGGMAFMGGAAKHEYLKAHKPHLYVDDQMVHLTESAKYCPTGLVAYPTGGPMYAFLQEQKAAEAAKATAAVVAAPVPANDVTPNVAAFTEAAVCGGKKACVNPDCTETHAQMRGRRRGGPATEPK